MTLIVLTLKTPRALRILTGSTIDEPIDRVEGWYGSELDLGDLRTIRQRLIDLLVQKHRARFSEKWFLPRFLGSVGVFVLVFFVLSYGIRDPLPIVDEVVVALLIAIVVFLAWSRAGMRSLEFKHQVEEIHRTVNQALLKPSSRLVEMEGLLHYAESLPPADLWEALSELSSSPPAESTTQDSFLEILEAEVRTLSHQWETARSRLGKKSLPQRAALIESWILEGKDLALLYLFLRARALGSASLPSGAEVP